MKNTLKALVCLAFAISMVGCTKESDRGYFKTKYTIDEVKQSSVTISFSVGDIPPEIGHWGIAVSEQDPETICADIMNPAEGVFLSEEDFRTRLEIYSCTIDGLATGTNYIARAWFYNDQTNALTWAPKSVSFKTKDLALPVISSISISNITGNSATVQTEWDGAQITEMGIYVADSEAGLESAEKITGDGTFMLSKLKSSTEYFVKAYAINSIGTGYSDVKTFTTEKASPYIAGKEYVDLELTSGLKWAACNIGAEKSTDYGQYFSWGETEEKQRYDWRDYKYCDNGNYQKMTKYFQGCILEDGDDAAIQLWGETWRMPTSDEFSELKSECTWALTAIDGVNGYTVTGKNGNFIFLPCGGYKNSSNFYGENENCNYWTSHQGTGQNYYADYLNANPKETPSIYIAHNMRNCGLTIRPVSE